MSARATGGAYGYRRTTVEDEVKLASGDLIVAMSERDRAGNSIIVAIKPDGVVDRMPTTIVESTYGKSEELDSRSRSRPVGCATSMMQRASHGSDESAC
jgi:hypothetical protein